MRPSLDETYLSMLPIYAARHTCARRAVAAIIIDKQGRFLSAGFNGPPKGLRHCTEHPCPGAGDVPGDTRYCEAVHAEANALLQCPDLDRAYVIYCSCTPCFECAKMICNTNIAKVIVTEPYADPRGYEILQRKGVLVVITAKT